MKEEIIVEPHKSSLGMEAKWILSIVFGIALLLSWTPFFMYIAFVVPGIFFFLEKESSFVKFYCARAVIVEAAFAVISLALTVIRRIIMIPLSLIRGGYGIRGLFSSIFTFAGIVLTIGVMIILIYMVIKAYNYKQVELPVFGPLAVKLHEKLASYDKNPVAGDPYASTSASGDNAGGNTAGGNTAKKRKKPVLCGECGTKNENGMKFCSECGKPLA